MFQMVAASSAWAEKVTTGGETQAQLSADKPNRATADLQTCEQEINCCEPPRFQGCPLPYKS